MKNLAPRTRLVFLAPVLLWTLSSCNTYYNANNVNMPLFTGPGEMQFHASTGFNGSNIQGSASLPGEIGVMANYGTYSRQSWNDSSETNNRRLFEVGVGKFESLGGIGVFEVYGGGGMGRSNYDYSVWNENDSRYDLRRGTSSFGKFFAQANVGVSSSFVDAGFGIRISYLNFGEVNLEGGGNLDALKDAVFWEPVLMARFGGKGLKLFTEFGFSALSADLANDGIAPLAYNPLIMSIGLHYTLKPLP